MFYQAKEFIPSDSTQGQIAFNKCIGLMTGKTPKYEFSSKFPNQASVNYIFSSFFFFYIILLPWANFKSSRFSIAEFSNSIFFFLFVHITSNEWAKQTVFPNRPFTLQLIYRILVKENQNHSMIHPPRFQIQQQCNT